MRDIRFRAWDGKKVWPVLAIDWNYQTIETTLIPGQGVFSLPLSQVELMQYTGLKDKNGKEIYEGDILKSAGIVAWNDVEARWSCIDIEWNDKREWHDMLYLTTPLEVIGNIYENKDLLK